MSRDTSDRSKPPRARRDLPRSATDLAQHLRTRPDDEGAKDIAQRIVTARIADSRGQSSLDLERTVTRELHSHVTAAALEVRQAPHWSTHRYRLERFRVARAAELLSWRPFLPNASPERHLLDAMLEIDTKPLEALTAVSSIDVHRETRDVFPRGFGPVATLPLSVYGMRDRWSDLLQLAGDAARDQKPAQIERLTHMMASLHGHVLDLDVSAHLADKSLRETYIPPALKEARGARAHVGYYTYATHITASVLWDHWSALKPLDESRKSAYLWNPAHYLPRLHSRLSALTLYLEGLKTRAEAAADWFNPAT